MGKKILGLLAIGLVFALIIPVGSAYARYNCELSAIGVIQIDRENSVIKGFVLFGNNDGEAIRFSFINIKFDEARTPLVMPSEIPFFMHHIDYNPAK